MSRVGNKPILVPAGVEVTVNESNQVTVKGPKGTLTKEFCKDLTIKLENGVLVVERPNETKSIRAIHGTTRALINNMVEGVTNGFRKTLNLVGVGYRAAAKGKGIELALGYSHPVIINEVEGIDFTIDKNTTIHIDGIEKQLVGQVASEIRSKRAPEPYKGKGVKYADEVIRRKEGKKA